ncbi:MAG: substrate-binding domain-containing protein [Salinivirgaceae bacterium]|nr:substrate-binding domain-containing protein [Salinivirgaceae bacterium]
MKDIAKELQVSTALVSYVLTGRENEKRVSIEMAEKIRKVAKDLNYKPSQLARSLRGGATMTIGLLLADIANPFFASLARIIEDEAAKRGYVVLIGSSDESAEKSASLLDTFIDRQVDGFIIVPTEGSKEQIESLMEKNNAIVLLDRYFPDLNTSHVCLNNYNAIAEATTHLIQKGHNKIVMFVYQSSQIPMQERVRGYVETMKGLNLERNIKVVEVPYSFTKLEKERLIKMTLQNDINIDAVIFANNSLTIIGLYAIYQLGLKVPEEIAIIGFDGSEVFDFFYAPLTYVEQPLVEIGIKSVETLIGIIEGATEIKQFELAHTFHIRNSS